jgi:flagellar assembly factor FliW
MTATIAPLVCRSPKLGDISYSREDVIRFPQGLPGFEQLRDFLLVTRQECEPFVFLTSLERPEVALPLIPLALAAAGFTAVAESLAPLGRATEAATAHYAVVSIGTQASDIIVNLRAPVIVNLDSRLGRQVILPDERLPVNAQLGA